MPYKPKKKKEKNIYNARHRQLAIATMMSANFNLPLFKPLIDIDNFGLMTK